MDTQDKNVMVQLLIVIGSLVLLTVIIVMLARLMGAMHNESSSASAEEMKNERLALVAERIQRIGSLEAADPSAVPVARSGKEIVAGVCASCHSSGVLGAPKIGDAAAWGSLLSIGFDGLLKTATDGKGAMPAKGGDPSLSELELKKAIAQMLKDSGQDAPNFAAAPPAIEFSAAGSPAAVGAQAPLAPIEPLAEISATVEPINVAAVSPSTAAPATTDAAQQGKGRSVYDMACAACHATGAANAPVVGNKDAWVNRIALGIDEMLNAAMYGKGAMPPKGGRLDLDEDAIQAAVEFMIAESR